MLSIPHMIVVFIVVLVVFGPQKLPELARGLGKLMAEFRKASTDFRSAFEEEMRDLERQALLAERKKAADAVAASAAAEPSQSATSGTAEAVQTTEGPGVATAAATEVPVISPMEEAVPRSDESSETKTGEATTASAPESHQNAPHSA